MGHNRRYGYVAFYRELIVDTQITEEDIARLITVFYASVRKDALLAPIFATRIKAEQWDEHITHIGAFWSSIFLKTGRFSGNPMRKHLSLKGLTPAHFERWLHLFRAAGVRALDTDKSAAFNIMADRIAKSFQMGLAFHHESKGETDHPFQDFALKRPS